MTLRRIPFFLLLMLLLPSAGRAAAASANVDTFHFAQDHAERIRHWLVRVGDDPAWAEVQADTAGWEPAVDSRSGGPARGIRWYRAVVELCGEQDDFDVLALSTSRTLSAYELYWDGEFVERCGVVGRTPREEVPGPVTNSVKLRRDQTTPGRHVVALRLSNHRADVERPLGSVRIGYHYGAFYSHSYKSSHRVFVGGGFLIAGLFCIAMFFAGSRHRSYLLFAVFCLIRLSFDLYTMMILYNDVSAEHYRWIMWLLRYGFFASHLLFVLFVIFTYGLPRKALAAGGSVALLAVSIVLQAKAPALPVPYSELMPVYAAALLVFAATRRSPGAGAALIGVIVWRLFKYPHLSPLADGVHMYSYIFSDIALLFCVVLSISRMIHGQNVQLHEVRMRSARLEADLLKKNIQPHFILNTLQSVMSWTKSDPDKAAKVVEALAEEFRMIRSVADKPLIPLHREIDLCRTHLKIMGFRMGSAYALETDGLCDDDRVPPLVFHTLVENALTHSFRTREDGVIRLTCETNDRYATYRLTNPGSRLKEMALKPDEEIREGMGLRYIRSRLEESFPGGWELDYELTGEQWTVTIRIRRRKADRTRGRRRAG